MIESIFAYRQLITSTTSLAFYRQSASVEQLLCRMKEVWKMNSLDKENLIHLLNQHNQEISDIDPALLANTWLPYRYQREDRGVSWCLPHATATEPFHDQYIERCRQQIPLNQFLCPRTALSRLLSWNNTGLPAPAGFIFHLSRCGSTLLSSSFAELDDANVLSESRLLTDVLLDSSLSDTDRKAVLPKLISLQGDAVPNRNKIIIKWNAWDILFWPLIRSVYPDVPVLLVVRDPVEILASHHRLPGRHMAGDPSLSQLHADFSFPIGDTKSGCRPLLIYRVQVLSCLMEAMLRIAGERNVRIIDYNQLILENIIEIIRYFGFTTGKGDAIGINNRMHFHSKEPNRRFYDDRIQKQQILDSTEIEFIQENLRPLYQKLSYLTK